MSLAGRGVNVTIVSKRLLFSNQSCPVEVASANSLMCPDRRCAGSRKFNECFVLPRSAVPCGIATIGVGSRRTPFPTLPSKVTRSSSHLRKQVRPCAVVEAAAEARQTGACHCARCAHSLTSLRAPTPIEPLDRLNDLHPRDMQGGPFPNYDLRVHNCRRPARSPRRDLDAQLQDFLGVRGREIYEVPEGKSSARKPPMAIQFFPRATILNFPKDDIHGRSGPVLVLNSTLICCRAHRACRDHR